MKLSIIVLFLGLLDWSLQITKQPPKVSTPLGVVKGSYRKSKIGRKYEAYEGIPYAQPPIKRLRFRPPKPVKKWSEELDATTKGPVCLQYRIVPENGSRVIGQENCLYLNVYTPQKKYDDGLPVMVWIHGGAFQFSSANEANESLLMDRKIVLVTINYRLGPLGFLSTGDGEVLGNMGLKDQTMALRWISENIVYFGGNRDSVTLLGVNAGGASVHYHYLSPLSAGLFHRGISLSGVALDPWPQTKRAPENAKQLGNLLACPTDTMSKLVACLRKRPAELITSAVGDFLIWLYNPFTPFGPVIEKQKCPRPFVNDTPIAIIKKGKAQDVPWITGVVSEEGLFPAAEFVADDKLLKQLNDNWSDIAPYLLDYNDTIPLNQQKEVAEKARNHYLGTKEISSDTVKPLIHMIGDRLFAVNFEKAARLQSSINKSPVWTYYYDYRAKHSESDVLTQSNTDFGVSQGDDIGLILNPRLSTSTKLQDALMQKLMIELYTSFAIKGIPKIGLAKWKQVNPEEEKFRYLRIGGPIGIGMICVKNFAESQFWNTINFNENKL